MQIFFAIIANLQAIVVKQNAVIAKWNVTTEIFFRPIVVYFHISEVPNSTKYFFAIVAYVFIF